MAARGSKGYLPCSGAACGVPSTTPYLSKGEVSLASDAYSQILELVQEFAGDGVAPALLRDSAYWLLGLYHFDR